MQALNQFVRAENAVRQAMQQKPYTYPLTQDDVSALTDRLNSELSPENIYCDGECSDHEAEQKYVLFGQAASELIRYASNHNYPTPLIHI
jgi:hypothetical protein